MTQPGAKPALPFDLTLTDEQRITRETMQRFAETVIKPQARSIDESNEIPAEMLQQAHELGITLLPVPDRRRLRPQPWSARRARPRWRAAR